MTDFFISSAYAQSAAAQGGNTSFLVMMVLFFVIFYFMLMRPQMKQAKEHKKLIEGLSKGDEIVTTGGLLGKIIEVGDNFIVLHGARIRAVSAMSTIFVHSRPCVRFLLTPRNAPA